MGLLLLLDAVIGVARADVPREWARYCEIAPGVIGDVPDAAREMLRRALWGGFDSALKWVNSGPEDREAGALEKLFRERFVAAIHAGRYRVVGFRREGFAATVIERITVEALQHVKGEQWELNGATLYGVYVEVVTEPAPPPPSPPKLEDVSDPEIIHVEIAAEYADHEKAGRKPPQLERDRQAGPSALARQRALREPR
jgi:hypothetical protein